MSILPRIASGHWPRHRRCLSASLTRLLGCRSYGLPVSLKDCFDLAGFPTTCGSRFYAEHNGIASQDSWVAERLRSQGAVITGKTHLHQLAYGITGENSEYGDCSQPRNPAWLTGGSSSGAAASVQEGSAVAAIGTDTGGSIRCPAALCGLAGYRSSVGLGDWRGAAHLAPSFDTLGWLFRDLRDAPLLANALLDVPVVHSLRRTENPHRLRRSGISPRRGAAGVRAFEGSKRLCAVSGSVSRASMAASGKNPSRSLRRSRRARQQRSTRGISTTSSRQSRNDWPGARRSQRMSCASCAAVMRNFALSFDRLFESYDFLILPCAPVSALAVGADHSDARGEDPSLHLAGQPRGNTGRGDSARRRRGAVDRAAWQRCRSGCLRRLSRRDAAANKFCLRFGEIVNARLAYVEANLRMFAAHSGLRRGGVCRLLRQQAGEWTLSGEIPHRLVSATGDRAASTMRWSRAITRTRASMSPSFLAALISSATSRSRPMRCSLACPPQTKFSRHRQ